MRTAVPVGWTAPLPRCHRAGLPHQPAHLASNCVRFQRWCRGRATQGTGTVPVGAALCLFSIPAVRVPELEQQQGPITGAHALHRSSNDPRPDCPEDLWLTRAMRAVRLSVLPTLANRVSLAPSVGTAGEVGWLAYAKDTAETSLFSMYTK